MPIAPLLRGNRLSLSAYSADDFPECVRWYQDVEFLRLLDARPAMPQSVAAIERWLDEQHKDELSFLFIIRLLNTGVPIGYLQLDGILWTHRSAWLTIAIGNPAMRGMGYGREALELLLDFAFRELNLYRVQLTVFAYNLPAIRLYEGIGFTHEGTYREALERDGARHHMLLYGLLRSEWQGRRRLSMND